jgi:hypothetical protein
MALDNIRKTYNVPARRGQRVRYKGDSRLDNGYREGVITSARGAHICVRLDGDKHPGIYHPTWEMEYLPSECK